MHRNAPPFVNLHLLISEKVLLFIVVRELPSLRPFFSVWYGSFALCALADFRPQGHFSAFGTEVAPWNYIYIQLSASIYE